MNTRAGDHLISNNLGPLSKFRTVVLTLLAILPALASANNWFAVNDHEIKNSQCTILKPTATHEMQDYLFYLMEDPDNLVNKRVGSFHFFDESPELIQLFEKMHTVSYTNESRVELLKNKKNCKKVLCALEENYGKNEALLMLYIQAKFGFTTSPYASEVSGNYQKWKAHELQNLIMSLETLPPQLFPVTNRHLLRFLQGYTLKLYSDGGSNVVANARIDIFDPWDAQTQIGKILVLVHEMGHVVGSINEIDRSPEWVELSKQNPISKYAETNPQEDFAESFLAYRFSPRKLNQTSSAKYQFIKNKVFNGFEFKNKKDCEGPYLDQKNRVLHAKQNYSKQLKWAQNNQKNVQEELNRITKVLSFDKNVMQSCAAVYLSELNHKSNRENTYGCIQKVLVKRAAEIELIDQSQEGSKISMSQFKNLNVDQNRLQLERERLRNQVNQELQRLYSDMNVSYKKDKEGLNDLFRYSKTQSLLLTSPDSIQAVQSLFVKTLTDSTLIGMKRFYFGISFDQWIP